MKGCDKLSRGNVPHSFARATALASPPDMHADHLTQRTLAAFGLSLLAHGAIIAWFGGPRIELPVPGAFDPIEVVLAGGPRAAAARLPRPLPKPEPSERSAAESAAPAPESGDGAERAAPHVEARYDVAALNNPKPPYPLAARRRGIEGRVVLSVLVRTDGTSGGVTLKQSSSHAVLDTSALDTVRRWRFLPARRGATPVESRVDVPIVFRLEGRG